MDIDFIVQDTFSLTRPQWKLARDFEEAGRAFADLVKQNYKTQHFEKAVEPEEPEDDSSDGELDEDDLQVPEMDEGQSSGEEADAEEPPINDNTHDDSDYDEQIVVTRQEEERDPQAEAEFDRELQKMMSESLDSRKFERKPLFDVPLPMRRAQRPQTAGSDGSDNDGAATPPAMNTMAFSLMTKKGSKANTKTIDMPSDSQFAVAMRNQREAEREEQQRIKNHILNLDLQEPSPDTFGTPKDFLSDPFLSPNPNLHKRSSPLGPLDANRFTHHDAREGSSASDKHQHNPSLGRATSSNAAKAADKSSSNRRGDRARKLQLSDVDWYEKTEKPSSSRSRDRRSHGRFS